MCPFPVYPEVLSRELPDEAAGESLLADIPPHILLMLCYASICMLSVLIPLFLCCRSLVPLPSACRQWASAHGLSG